MTFSQLVLIWCGCGIGVEVICCVDVALMRPQCVRIRTRALSSVHTAAGWHWTTLSTDWKAAAQSSPQKTMWKVNHLSSKCFEQLRQIGKRGEIISWGLNLWTEMVTNHSCFDLFTFVNISLRKEACWCLIDNLNLFLSFSATAQSRQSTQCAQSRQLIF